MSDKHFELIISGTAHSEPVPVVTVEMNGCGQCMETAITELMVYNGKFRELINKCGKAANVIRENQRKGNQGPNPQMN